MFVHYLKITFRNLLKYKTQNVISIVGLAIGLATYSLSSIWLKYETSYDTHWPDAERIYQIGEWKENEMEKFNEYTSLLTPNRLKEQFPEIETSCAFCHREVTEKGKKVWLLKADTAYTQVFPLTILQGNDQFLHDTRLAAITESAAKRLFGTTEVLGETLSMKEGMTICALLKDNEGHSNYPYDIIISSKDEQASWGMHMAITIAKLVPNADVEKLNEKLKKHELVQEISNPVLGNIKSVSIDPYIAIPLSAMHYTYPSSADAIRLEHIRLFNAVGLIVVACALLNYLILYIIRLYIRRREMALRRANGASEWSLLAMTMTELLILAGCAFFVGMTIAELLFRPFKDLTGITESIGFLYRESALYMAGVILITILLASVVLFAQQRHSLRAALQPISSGGRFLSFRRLGITFQVIVSILVMFATITLQKQLHHLHHSPDMGFTNMDVVIAEGWISQTKEEVDPVMEEIPYIRYYKTEQYPFDTSFRYGSANISFEDEKGEIQSIESKNYPISLDAYTVFGMQTIAGKSPTETDHENTAWVNEAFVAKLGMRPTDVIGQLIRLDGTFTFKNGKLTPQSNLVIRGVVKDIQLSPILPSVPTYYQISKVTIKESMRNMVERHRFLTTSIKDMNALEDSIRNHLKRRIPGAKDQHIYLTCFTVRQQIEAALQSERVLLKLLGIASGVCILITLFGIFSMVKLSCKRRCKEIAIRKVHGAKVKNIVGLFAKEYGILLIISSAISFPIGYAVMKSWLQTYVIQTPVSWWIYASILLSIALLITLCVGYLIWKAANENPADVVKSE